MIGSAFFLADPFFQGLAISLVFGLASVTALTLLAIHVAPRDDEETPKTQNREMKTWFKIGRN
jgi:hypothetical protein